MLRPISEPLLLSHVSLFPPRHAEANIGCRSLQQLLRHTVGTSGLCPSCPLFRQPHAKVHCVVLQYLLSVVYRVQISAWYTTSARLHGATPAFFVKPLYQAVEPRDHRLRQPILGFCPIVVRV